ncbi:PAS domain-containing protein [Micromonospora sp. STR1s_5]|nr:PAS domain-containing protein [Micromonospora sp. STR1s_5]
MVASVTRKPPGFGVVHVTLDGVIISCDDGYASFLGVPREDAVGRRISEFIAVDVGAGGPETMISIIMRTGEPMSIRRTFVRPDGTTVRCAFQLCLIRGADDHPHSVVGVGQAIGI